MHCHLLIPALFPPGAVTRQNDPLHDIKAPALQTLLARGEKGSSAASNMENWLCEAFGVAQQLDYPVASLCALAQGIKPGNRYWLRADPAFLSVERDQLILEQAPVSQLSKDESAALIATLNQHFASDGLHFLASGPEQWYLSLDEAAAIHTQTLHQALGKSIHPLLPDGPEAMRWRALLNEMQMLLFEHPVNVAREAHGMTPVNSIWPWGGGTLPAHVQSPFDQIWANDNLARGLALAADLTGQLLPDNTTRWLEEASSGNHLLVLDTLRTPACYGDPHGWREQLLELEKRWFVPLKQAVQRNRMELSLHIPTSGGTLDFFIQRGSLWRLWRPVKELLHYRPPE